MAELNIVDNAEQNRFEVRLGDDLATLEYRRHGDTITLRHTEVPPAFRHHGVAEILARAALESARARNLKVVPLCPYVTAFIKRHKEYQSLLAPPNPA